MRGVGAIIGEDHEKQKETLEQVLSLPHQADTQASLAKPWCQELAGACARLVDARDADAPLGQLVALALETEQARHGSRE